MKRSLTFIFFILFALLALGQQRMTQKGLDQIKTFERYVGNAYLDKFANVWTNGFGNTVGVKKGDYCTLEEATITLNTRIFEYTNPMNRWLKRVIKPCEYDATGCLAWNRGSIEKGMQNAINTGNKDLVRYYFYKVVYSKGVYVYGLDVRRHKEFRTYDQGIYWINGKWVTD